MLCLFDTGTIDLRKNVLTWNIPDFFSLPLSVGSEIRTAEFQYGGVRYTLALWPRGLKGAGKEWFGVCLYSRGASKHHGSIEVSIMTGGRVFRSCSIMCSENPTNRNVIYKNATFMEWSDFSVLKRQIAPYGCLTIVCTLPLEEDICLEHYELDDSIAGVEDGIECLRSLSDPQFSFSSADYSFLTSSCMIRSSSLNSSSGEIKTSVAPDAKSRDPPSGITNSIFDSTSDAFDLPSHAHSALTDSDSPEICNTVAAAANSNGKHKHKRTATAAGTSISFNTGDEMTNAQDKNGRLRKPGSNDESQNAANSSQTRNTSNHATASKNSSVYKEKMPPCRQASLNPTSQLPPRQSTIGGSHRISSSDSARNFETVATAWDESPASSVRAQETSTSGFGTCDAPRMSNTHRVSASAIASEEGRTPAHVLYSAGGIAGLPHFAEIYHYKGPLNRKTFETRPLTENSPLTFLGYDKLSKLKENFTTPSASDAIRSAKRHTATIDEADVLNSAVGVPTDLTAANAVSNNHERYISAARKGPETAAEAISSDFADNVSSKTVSHSSCPEATHVAGTGVHCGEEASFAPTNLNGKIKEASGTEHVSSSDDATNGLETQAEFRRHLQSGGAEHVSGADDAANGVETQAEFRRHLQSGGAEHVSGSDDAANGVETQAEFRRHLQSGGAEHVSGSDDAANGVETQAEFRRHLQSGGAEHVSGSDDAANGVETQAEFRRHLQSMENLSEALRRLYLRSEGCDQTVKVGDHEFRVHRAILKLRSPVFEEMFFEHEFGTLEIPPGSCDPGTFHDFLLFVYDGRLGNVTEANAFGMYRAAQYFRFPELRAQCVEFIKNSLSVRSVCDVLSAATQRNEPELLEMATVYFARNVKEILKTDEFKQFWRENFDQANELIVKSLDFTKTSS